jgi:ABC-type nitrate/sulfonate/bicarbonate transport system ATPase subunit
MELLEHSKKKPSALSGGEKQRVAIARAFLTGAPVLLLDEPFTALDTGLKRRLMSEFVGVWQEYRPMVLFVTHDLEEGLTLAHRIVVLKEGGVVLDEKLQGQIPRKYGECASLCERVLACLEK